MRVCTAFKRLLRLPDASVIDVSFGSQGVIVTVKLRRRRRVCSRCGQTAQSFRSTTTGPSAGGTSTWAHPAA